jgi:hypothetical protein
MADNFPPLKVVNSAVPLPTLIALTILEALNLAAIT